MFEVGEAVVGLAHQCASGSHTTQSEGDGVSEGKGAQGECQQPDGMVCVRGGGGCVGEAGSVRGIGKPAHISKSRLAKVQSRGGGDQSGAQRGDGGVGVEWGGAEGGRGEAVRLGVAFHAIAAKP